MKHNHYQTMSQNVTTVSKTTHKLSMSTLEA